MEKTIAARTKIRSLTSSQVDGVTTALLNELAVTTDTFEGYVGDSAGKLHRIVAQPVPPVIKTLSVPASGFVLVSTGLYSNSITISDTLTANSVVTILPPAPTSSDSAVFDAAQFYSYVEVTLPSTLKLYSKNIPTTNLTLTLIIQ